MHPEGFSPPLFSSSEDEFNEEADGAESQSIPPTLHTAVAMGTTKIAGAQKVLQEARLRNNEEVPVRMVPDPDNPVDKNAIAFKCWLKFGYAVTEVSDDLRSTMHNKLVPCIIIQH